MSKLTNDMISDIKDTYNHIRSMGDSLKEKYENHDVMIERGPHKGRMARINEVFIFGTGVHISLEIYRKDGTGFTQLRNTWSLDPGNGFTILGPSQIKKEK